ncbi:hypothetical protein GWI33_003792 [Rhynchophorus ferrugineus]|uniref:Mos1 transposase HTH domain-containing protein n=1 Tax=Rhynchophorus ferrugineus TaxID=354439 RepID=A0A834HWB5_RHYFE|nr:hypothetical protein GWI33_003792 [Rhynchophorus ferrugineus]
MDKKEFRVLIKYCFLKGKNTVEAKTRLDAEFPDTAPGKSNIKDWYAKFRRGEMSTEDGQRTGRLKEEVLLHQDNAPYYKSVKTMAKIHDLDFEFLPHPQYSPDLATIDYFLFSDFKRMLARRNFRRMKR